MAKIKTITAEMIHRCPRHSLILNHYLADGTCKCAEVEVVRLRKQISDLQAELRLLRQLRAEINDLHKGGNSGEEQ